MCNRGGDAAAVTGPYDSGPHSGGIRDWQLDMVLCAQETFWRLNGDVPAAT